METKETHIAQWVESRQIPEDLVPVVVNAFGKDPFDNKIIENYKDRIEETKKKIQSLADKLLQLMMKDLASDLSSQSEKTIADEKAGIINDVAHIYSALGVYTISNGVVHKWHRNVDKDTTSFAISDGNIWWDYLGEQTRIIELGGTIIVMLSSEGVKYLNDIANTVSSYTTTVTV